MCLIYLIGWTLMLHADHSLASHSSGMLQGLPGQFIENAFLKRPFHVILSYSHVLLTSPELPAELRKEIGVGSTASASSNSVHPYSSDVVGPAMFGRSRRRAADSHANDMFPLAFAVSTFLTGEHPRA